MNFYNLLIPLESLTQQQKALYSCNSLAAALIVNNGHQKFAVEMKLWHFLHSLCCSSIGQYLVARWSTPYSRCCLFVTQTWDMLNLQFK